MASPLGKPSLCSALLVHHAQGDYIHSLYPTEYFLGGAVCAAYANIHYYGFGEKDSVAERIGDSSFFVGIDSISYCRTIIHMITTEN